MSSETITLTSVCSGGNHLVFTGSGSKAISVEVMLADLTDTTISDEDAKAFAKVIAKLAKNGRTLAQAKTLLQAGVTITV